LPQPAPAKFPHHDRRSFCIVKSSTIPSADIDRLETWVRYRSSLCDSCMASCCTLPVEVGVADLVRMGLVDEFEAGEPPKDIAKRLKRAGIVDHFNGRDAIFTLARLASGDCIYLDGATRRCTIYVNRPTTCRNHPGVGPRPGFCAYKKR
jgi:Fe-S-cluster containining protein